MFPEFRGQQFRLFCEICCTRGQAHCVLGTGNGEAGMKVTSSKGRGRRLGNVSARRWDSRMGDGPGKNTLQPTFQAEGLQSPISRIQEFGFLLGSSIPSVPPPETPASRVERESGPRREGKWPSRQREQGEVQEVAVGQKSGGTESLFSIPEGPSQRGFREPLRDP